MPKPASRFEEDFQNISISVRTHVSELFTFTENENFDDGCFHFTNCIVLKNMGKFSEGDHIWDIALNFENDVIWIQKEHEEDFDYECMDEVDMPEQMKPTFLLMCQLYN